MSLSGPTSQGMFYRRVVSRRRQKACRGWSVFLTLSCGHTQRRRAYEEPVVFAHCYECAKTRAAERAKQLEEEAEIDRDMDEEFL